MSDKLLPLGDDRIGMTPDGPIGPPEAMRPLLDLWRRQQAALERGEDPTKTRDGRSRAVGTAAGGDHENVSVETAQASDSRTYLCRFSSRQHLSLQCRVQR